jgi:hypothetical protein
MISTITPWIWFDLVSRKVKGTPVGVEPTFRTCCAGQADLRAATARRAAKRLARKSAATGRQKTHGIVFDWQQWPHPLGFPTHQGRIGMGQASSTIDFAAALRDPTAIFSEPNDIVAHPQLSREMKLSLLRQWEQTARSLSVAESEGMGGGEENKLGRVELAIALVEKQP